MEMNSDARRVVKKSPEARIADALERIADSLAPPMLACINAEGVDVEALRDVLGKSQAGIIVSDRHEPRIVRRVPIMLSIAEGEGAPLWQCPPGLYLHGDTLIMKTQYSTIVPGGGKKPDCYIVDGGEYFCGGVRGEQIRDLIVQPVAYTLK